MRRDSGPIQTKRGSCGFDPAGERFQLTHPGNSRMVIIIGDTVHGAALADTFASQSMTRRDLSPIAPNIV
jgi:hypothetical protein